MFSTKCRLKLNQSLQKRPSTKTLHKKKVDYGRLVDEHQKNDFFAQLFTILHQESPDSRRKAW